eukprot:TRINITY_DN6952_c0_g2_i1.p1 TRINITY_DN6952_c0_g2~~TRINITY_DN6952_c0_g2_i1.p1  ORF type:complete len:137 (-),score=7.17 TRINITY_DN6952_c0_g2_i1:24-434(-)
MLSCARCHRLKKACDGCSPCARCSDAMETCEQRQKRRYKPEHEFQGSFRVQSKKRVAANSVQITTTPRLMAVVDPTVLLLIDSTMLSLYECRRYQSQQMSTSDCVMLAGLREFRDIVAAYGIKPTTSMLTVLERAM